MFPQETMLRYHLQYNHYPPVHPMFIESAQKAIEAVSQECPDHDITMPNDVTLMACEIVDQLHLDCFLEEETR